MGYLIGLPPRDGIDYSVKTVAEIHLRPDNLGSQYKVRECFFPDVVQSSGSMLIGFG